MTKDINILDLLALVEIFNEYDEFEKDLNKLLNKNMYKGEFIWLEQIQSKKHFLLAFLH